MIAQLALDFGAPPAPSAPPPPCVAAPSDSTPRATREDQELLEAIELGNPKRNSAGIIPFGQPHYILRVVRAGDDFGWSSDYSLHDCGGSGPARMGYTSHADARTNALKSVLDNLARTTTHDWDEKRPKQAEKLAHDLLAKFPPMLADGEDFAAYWQGALEAERADLLARDRAIELAAVLLKSIGAGLDAVGRGGAFDFGRATQGFIVKPTKPGESYTGEKLGWWWIEGHAETGAFVTVGCYDKHVGNQDFDRALAVIEAITEGATVRRAPRPLTHYGQTCAFGWLRYGAKGRSI